MIARLCLVNEFLVRGVEFGFECAEHLYWFKDSVKAFKNGVLWSVIGFTGDEVRMFVAVTLFVSDIPSLSQSPYLSLTFSFFINHLICLWHSVYFSIAFYILTFRFFLNHLLYLWHPVSFSITPSVSNIPFLSQSPCLLNSVSFSIILSVSDIPFFSQSPYLSLTFHFFLNHPICLWHSVYFSITIFLSDIPFLSQLPCLWHSVSFSILLSVSDIPFLS